MRASAIGALALGLALLWVPSSPALAQDCAEGRVLVSERCCWPGQDFDETTRACVGVPSCPEDFVIEGETCLPSLDLLTRRAIAHGRPGLRRPVDTAEPGDSLARALGSPMPVSYWPEPSVEVTRADAPNPRWRRDGWDDGLIAAGLALWGASYIVAVVPIPLLWARGPLATGGATPAWPACFIPLVPYLTQIDSSSVPWLFSLPSSIGQGVGFALVLAGVFAHVDEVRFGGVALRVLGSARGADVGGGLELAF